MGPQGPGSGPMKMKSKNQNPNDTFSDLSASFPVIFLQAVAVALSNKKNKLLTIAVHHLQPLHKVVGWISNLKTIM